MASDIEELVLLHNFTFFCRTVIRSESYCIYSAGECTFQYNVTYIDYLSASALRVTLRN